MRTWDYIRDRATPPTTYWPDELPTWLAVPVVLIRYALALLALPLLLIAIWAIVNAL